MILRHYESLPYTPAIALALEGWHELAQAGHCDPGGIFVAWDHHAIVAFDKLDHPLGVLTFTKQDWNRTCFVVIGWVLPAHRSRGVYRAMWDKLVVLAQEWKFARIEGTTAIENDKMRAVAKALGRKERGVYLWYDVPGGEDAPPKPSGLDPGP